MFGKYNKVGTRVYGGAIPGILDTYPNAAVAYSVRRLATAYTGPLLRVRRSSDNTEQDIGYTTLGDLDETALTNFVGANNGFVTTWYDQSGNANNLTQTTAANQPQIVSSGSVLTLNSKPAVNSATSLKRLDSINNISYSECYISTVFNRTGRTGAADSLYVFNNTPFNQLYSLGSDWAYYSNADYATTIPLSSSQKLITQVDNGTTTVFYDNATQNVSHNVSNNVTNLKLQLFAFDTSYGMFGNIQEFILYTSNQSSNRTGIQSNVNSYYGIY
jgi:hypothetical protein